MTDGFDGPVLITGASGFIGRRLRDALLDRGVDAVALRRPSSPEPGPNARGRAVVADYADLEGLTTLLEDLAPSHILHVAGATKGVTYDDFARANVMPTEHLLKACAKRPPKRFVLMSSLAAYGPSAPDRPHDDTAEPAPIEHYGASKLEAERVVEGAGVPYTILRPGGVYGPGDVDYFEIFKLAAQGWATFFGNRDRLFSAVYVDDLVQATLTAATHPGAENHGYFIGAGAPLSWGAFQDAVDAGAGRRVRRMNLPEGLVSIAAVGGELMTKLDGKPRLFNRQKALMGAQEAWTCTSEAATRDFGFAPQVDLPEGVRRAFAWYRAEGWIRGGPAPTETRDETT